MDYDKLTPMMRQYFEIKNSYQDYILFYRLGDFYEMFFDDAVTASRELELTLTGRNCGLEERAPLCGVPYHAADVYLSRLVEKGYKVAICEQVEDPALAKGLVKREVVRILTPGTVIDPAFLDERENNYVLALNEKSAWSVAYADITTGELKTTLFDPEKGVDRVLEEILKVKPSEIIVSKGFEGLHNNIMSTLTTEGYTLTTLPDAYFDPNQAAPLIRRVYSVLSLEGLGLVPDSAQLGAVGGLLAYIEETQKVDLRHFEQIQVYQTGQFMMLDKFAWRNLEIVETLRDKRKRGSLLWILDHTATSMGGRRLRQWLERPLLDTEAIERRLETVDLFVNDLILRSEVRELLKSVYDLERLSSKLVFGTVNARDLLALKSSLAILPDLKAILSDADATLLNQLRGEIDPLEDVYELIDRSIMDEPPISVKEGGLIRSDYNADLAELRDIVQNGKQWILDLETRERQRTGIKSLKVGFNKVFGYYLDITRTNSHLAPEDYQRKQTLANSERYITPELKSLEEKVLGAEERITGLEYELFSEIRTLVLAEVSRLKRTADAVAVVDVLTGLAELAYVQNYCRPLTGEPGALAIEGGRHPVIEKMFPKVPFIPNDASLDQDEQQFHIITGPNMAGKSTYLRQVALITLLYQIGSFVPAQRASLYPVDRIFTRVGASDDLSQGQSTFMVEMIELSHILRHATSQSLILLDEIGRGTSTYDGLSIAWAVVEHLSRRSGIRAKTMFATHYHELTELEGKFSGVKNFCIAVREQGEDIVFLRKIVRGGANQSFGIQVARLAGLPEAVVTRARQILKKLEENDINNNIQQLNDLDPVVPAEPSPVMQQLSFLTSGQAEGLVSEMAALDVLKMTPLEAMGALDRLINEARRINGSSGKGR